MPTIHWADGPVHRSARWHSENGTPAPRRVVVADDRTKAADAYRLACEGTALLWQGDYHGARGLLRAFGRRLDREPFTPGTGPAASFHLHRRFRGHRARILGKVLVLLRDDYTLGLRRAPDVRLACREAYGPPQGPTVVSLRELLGVIGAHQWRTKGVDIPALGGRIHPHYGVFSPVRGEYVDLVARAPSHGRCGTTPAASRPSTSAPEPACWPRSSPGGASAVSWPPTSAHAPSPAPGTTPAGWAWPTASR